MADTAIQKTIAHYQRAEVKQIITKFCQPAENEWRALNGDSGWYIGADTGGIRLRTPDDYDATINKYRTMYALLDIFMPSVKTQSTQWNPIKNEACETLGTLRECVAYTLGADIDSIAHDMKKPEIKAAVEALAGYLVKRLKDAGIKKSVHCLMSGGGIYVLLHHEMCRCPKELIGADREIFFRIRLDAFKMFLADVEHDFYEDHNDLREVVKIDKLTNQKRKFKCICSYHKKLDLAVIPLDPVNLVVDFAKAKLPLSDAVLAECASWYSTYASEEQEALSRLLEPYMVVTRETAKNHVHKAAMPTTDIPRRHEPLDATLFPPCMQNIIQHVAPGKGPHRALAVLSTYLYSIGWDDTKAIDVWSLLADKCGVEGRIFDQWYGQMKCPTCATIQQTADGYPNIGLGGLGYCVPDPHCKGCVWPGDYHNQKIIADAMKETTGPRFQYVSMASEPDTFGVNPIDGTVCKVFEYEDPITHEYIKSMLKISDCAVRIDTETCCDDLTEFTFVGKGAMDGRGVKFCMPAGDMALPYKFDVGVMNAFGINDLDLMSYKICREISLGTMFMKRVEVPGWKDDIPLIPGIEVPGIEYRLSQKVPALVYDGDLVAAKKQLRNAMQIHKSAPLVIATILGSPVFAKWFKKERFGLGIWGLSNSLKTSFVLAMLSMFGTGHNDEPAIKSGTQSNTPYARTVITAALGWLAYCYDNVKTVNPVDAMDYIQYINMVMEGSSKGQGTKDGKLKQTRIFSGTPIVTGEVRPQDAATTSRVPAIEWGGADADKLREVQQNIELMPVLGYNWLMHLSTITTIDRAVFDQYQSMKMKEFIRTGHTVAGRTATIYALLKLAWAMLEVSPLGEVFTEFEGAFIKALDALAASQGSATKEETESQRFMNGLRQLIASNPALFLEKGRPRNDSTFPVIGKWMAEGIWLMPEKTLAEMARFKVFTQIPTAESMTAALDRDKLLRHQISGKESRKTYLASFGGTKLKGWYIIMDTPDMVAKKDAADKQAAEEAMAGYRKKEQQETPQEPENGKKDASGYGPVTANQEQAAQSYRITGVTAKNSPIGEKTVLSGEEDKEIKSPLRDDKKPVTPVTPINKDATVAVVAVTEGLPKSYRNSIKTEVTEPIEQLPEQKTKANKDAPTDSAIEAELLLADAQTNARKEHFGKVAEEHTGPKLDPPKRVGTKKILSYSEMAGFVPYDTSSSETEKICRSFRGQLMKGMAPRIDFLVKETELPKESIEGYLNSAPWIRKDDSSPAGIVVYLPVEALA